MAKLSVKMLMIIAVVCGLIVASLMYIYLTKVNTREVSSEGVSVVVAKVDIPPKTLITTEMVQEKTIAPGGVQPGAIVDLKNAIGHMTMERIMAGEQIIDRRILLDAKSVGFTGAIPKDRRAVTVSATEVIGVSGMIKPGDSVDVLVTFDRKDDDIGMHATNIILQNLLVLAINKITDKPEGKEPENQKDKDFTVTLAVTPQEASRLVLADEKGKIRLALRPYIPEGDIIPATVVPQDLVASEWQTKSTPPSGGGGNSVQAPPPPVSNNQQPVISSGGIVIIRGTKMYVAPIN